MQELLIATRHILATDFRAGFVSQIDTLLDEGVLIGTGRTSYETLRLRDPQPPTPQTTIPSLLSVDNPPFFPRPLAYSTLADLVHHVRTELSLVQLSKVVYLFSRNIHDATLPFNIQTMSAKLLLNLVSAWPDCC